MALELIRLRSLDNRQQPGADVLDRSRLDLSFPGEASTALGAMVARIIHKRCAHLPEPIRTIARKAQGGARRYCRLIAHTVEPKAAWYDSVGGQERLQVGIGVGGGGFREGAVGGEQPFRHIVGHRIVHGVHREERVALVVKMCSAADF